MRIKSSIISDVLEVEDHAGNVTSFPFRVNVGEIAQKINAVSKKFAESNKDEERGQSFVELLGLIFGEETTLKMVEYYKDDYTAMVADLTPVLVDVIFPAVRAQNDKFVSALKKRKF